MPTLLDTLMLAKEEYNLSEAQHLRLLLRFQEEKDELCKRKFRKILEQEYQLEQLGPMYTSLKVLENKNAQLIKIQIAEKHNNMYCWATINPKTEVSFPVFKKKIEKIVKYSCFKAYAYVFEQRGTFAENNIGKGFHAHLLFRRNLSYKPKDLEQRIRRGCKEIVGNINDNRYVNLTKIGKDYAIDKYRYMTGLKQYEKQEKQSGDIHFRKKYNLNSIYIKNISPDIIDAQKKENSINKKTG